MTDPEKPERIHHCEFCGENVGPEEYDYSLRRRIWVCCKPACEKELREMLREDAISRREAAEEDDYSRY